MPMSQDSLRRAAVNYKTHPRVRSLQEAKSLNVKSGFLCHSHKDVDLVRGLVAQLRDAGLDIYVDWEDSDMPSQPNKETADRIRKKIVSSDLFLFLATSHSISSRWCPWEIGYADGKKPIESIILLPTSDAHGTYGNEYLQLYRRIEEFAGSLRVIEPGKVIGESLIRL
jgi:hypothetical protein